MKKKMISLLLALVMCMTLCVPAMATKGEAAFLDEALEVLDRLGAPIDEITDISFSDEMLMFSIGSEHFVMELLADGKKAFIVTDGNKKIRWSLMLTIPLIFWMEIHYQCA